MTDRLVSRDYCFILLANFLLYFGFFLLMPVLPFYLVEEFGISKGMTGFILACYTIAALVVRPFSGYLLDTLHRKPLYLISFLVFTMIFGGYILTGSLLVFIMLRIVHGLSFGTVTVAGNTIVIDITPSSRRGEALGYYGLANNIAMALGPMIGLFLHGRISYDQIFLVAFSCTLIGFILANMVKCPPKPQIKRPPISLDRFILVKGIPASIALLLLSIPYGATTNYVAVYAKEIGIPVETGFFFTCMAIGMGVSRMFSGKWVDKGYVCKVISQGFYLIITAFALLSSCAFLVKWNTDVCSALFFIIPLMLGVGFGIMFPAYNTLYVNLAPNNQRATATSTYLTAWDVGSGIGIFTGGMIAELLSFDKVYLFGAILCVISMIYFNAKVTPHYEANKVR